MRKKTLKTTVLIIVFAVFSLIVNSCGNRKTELNKTISEKSAELEQVKKSAAELHELLGAKNLTISEQKIEIEHLKTSIERTLQERKDLSEKSSSENQEEFVVTGANGSVVITDKDGNKWEIQSGINTQISKSTISKILSEKKELLEKLQTAIEVKEKLEANIHALERNEDILEREISKKQNENTSFIEKIKSLESSKNKKTETEALYWKVILISIITGYLIRLFQPYILKHLTRSI